MSAHTIALPLLHLLDPRPPQQVQALIERNSGVVLAAADGQDHARVACLSTGKGQLSLTLRWLGTLPQGHHFTIESELLMPDGSGQGDADFQRTLQAEQRRAQAWLDLWTHGLQVRKQPPQGAASTAQHSAVLQGWQAAEAALADAAQVKQMLLAALRAGQILHTVHKEGSTTLRFDGSGFVREDRGDWSDTRRFDSDEAFLQHLREFHAREVGRNATRPLNSDSDVWRLIYRRLEPAAAPRAAAPAPGGAGKISGIRLVLVILVCTLAGAIAYLKWHPRAQALRGAGDAQLPRAVVQPPPPVSPAQPRR